MMIEKEDPERLIGWGGLLRQSEPYVIFLKKPLAEVIFDAVMEDFQNIGYSVYGESEAAGLENQSRYYLEIVLKYARSEILQDWTLKIQSRIILEYRLKDSNDTIIHNARLEKRIIKDEGQVLFSRKPLGDVLINECLPRIIEKLIPDAVSEIEADLVLKRIDNR